MIGEGFAPRPDGTVTLRLHPETARLLRQLFDQLAELLTGADGAPEPGPGAAPVDPLAAELGLTDLAGLTDLEGFGADADGADAARSAAPGTPPPDDPALARLLPDAYPEDPEASAEFRRYTRADLGKQRRERISVAAAGLDRAGGRGSVKLNLSRDEAGAWLGALNDLRVVLGTRLELTSDEQVPGDNLAPDDPRRVNVPVYHYLGGLQENLLEALTGDDGSDLADESDYREYGDPEDSEDKKPDQD